LKDMPTRMDHFRADKTAASAGDSREAETDSRSPA
jgi:hypothetical protein